ncbi:DUF4199 domain-containing protein [Chitinophaga vietnamensis]|uniref:DUF4199 domain-containing protein n=1 Tax=Chitinophaga vietnamensis TaxID=2593957 RepID=UPI001178BCDA|nr:DUF4199 domain-containing protein [Chitinophaga vietnamensis]
MTKKNHLLYGIITGIALILISIVLYVTKLNQQSWAGWISLVVLMAGVILSCIDYGKNNEGLTFGNIFANGFRTTAVITVLSVLFTILFITIFPDVKDQALEAARQKMEAQHQSEETIEKALEITKKMFIPFVIGGSLLSNVFFGAIAALIGAAVARKAKPGQPPVQ